MARKFILYFADDIRTLSRWRRSGLVLEKRFSPGNEALDDLRESLNRCRGALLHVVVDLAGEDFHEETIPLLHGAERRIVIERRLVHRYRDARLAAALSLGSRSDERKNERVLLATFPQTDAFRDWLDVLLQAPVTLASVVSTGMIAPAIASKLKPGPTLLLVSVHSAGLRQSFLADGRLRLSRLEHVPAEGISPALVRREVERTLEFLHQPRVPVVLLLPDEDRARFQAELEGCETLGILQAAERLGLRQLPPSTGAEALHLHMAVLRPPKEQFLRGADRRPFMEWRLRRATAAIGASAFAACAGYAGLLWFEGKAARTEIASVRQQVALRPPIAPANAEVMKAAALEFRRIVARTTAPEFALVHLSHALDQSHGIELDSLAWESTDSATQTLEISARVDSPAQADHREIGRRVERFSDLLVSSEWRIAGRRMPFDAAPQNPLSGDFGAREAGERTRFSITLVRPLQ